MTQEEIIFLIDDKITDLHISNSFSRNSDDYYLKNDAKIEVLEEILRKIQE